MNKESNTCLDVDDFVGPAVDIWTCNGGVNQDFTLNSDGTISTAAAPGKPSLCLAAKPNTPAECSNVWGRKLSNNNYALGFVNNAPTAVNVTCDASCFSKLNITAKALLVRDVWAHEYVAKLTAPFEFTSTVAGNGFANLYRLEPN